MADEQNIPLSVLRSYSPHPDKLDLTGLTQEEITHGIKSSNLPDYIRYKQYLTDTNEALAQLAEMIIQFAVNLGLDPDQTMEWARKLQESVSQSEFDSWVATLLDGGPSIFVNTLSELQAKYPNGAAGVALVRETDPAKIYVWTGSAWEDFGDYQGIELKDNSITSDKLVDGTIPPGKTTFFDIIKPQNALDRTKTVHGEFVNQTSGNFDIAPTYERTNYINIDKSKPYIIISHPSSTDNGTRYAIKDTGGKYIIGANLNTWQSIVINGATRYYYVIPNQSNYATIAISFINNMQKFMLEFSDKNVASAYTEYFEAVPYIDASYLPLVDGSKILDGTITKNKVDFEVIEPTPSKNIANQKYLVFDNFVSQTTGQLSSNAVHDTYHKIPIKSSTTYTISNFVSSLRVAYYDVNSIFVSGEPFPANSTITTPTNARFISTSFSGADPHSVQIEEGAVATPYTKSGYTLPELIVDNLAGATTQVEFNLPPKIYGVVGQELDIYFKNIIDQKDTILDFDVESNFGKQMSDRLNGVPDKASTTNINISAYKDYQNVGSGNTSLVTTNITTKDVKLLYFGDSTVNAGGITQRLLDLYSTEASNLTLLGTRGLGTTNRYEGRGGWGAATYRTPLEAYGEPNPFYNPTKSDFDFNYYMSQQGYTGLDHFIIQLGINDTFGMSSDAELNTKIDTILNDFDFIVGNVKSYNSTIKVGVAVTIPPNASQDAFGNAYGNGQTQWRYKRNNAIWVKRLIEHFKEKEAQGIYLVPMQHNIDTTININDGVHPKQAGYDQMGDSVYAYLKNIG